MPPTLGRNVDALAVREAHVGDQPAFDQLADHPPPKPRQRDANGRHGEPAAPASVRRLARSALNIVKAGKSGLPAHPEIE
jgi:hypothetical protein